MRVVVQGRLKARTWETREGEKRTSFEIDVEEIGPSLKFATAKVNRVSRGGGGGGYSSGGQQAGGAAADDPWATPAPQGSLTPAGGQSSAGGDPWGAPGVATDEPPF